MISIDIPLLQFSDDELFPDPVPGIQPELIDIKVEDAMPEPNYESATSPKDKNLQSKVHHQSESESKFQSVNNLLEWDIHDDLERKHALESKSETKANRGYGCGDDAFTNACEERVTTEEEGQTLPKSEVETDAALASPHFSKIDLIPQSNADPKYDDDCGAHEVDSMHEQDHELSIANKEDSKDEEKLEPDTEPSLAQQFQANGGMEEVNQPSQKADPDPLTNSVSAFHVEMNLGPNPKTTREPKSDVVVKLSSEDGLQVAADEDGSDDQDEEDSPREIEPPIKSDTPFDSQPACKWREVPKDALYHYDSDNEEPIPMFLSLEKAYKPRQPFQSEDHVLAEIKPDSEVKPAENDPDMVTHATAGHTEASNKKDGHVSEQSGGALEHPPRPQSRPDCDTQANPASSESSEITKDQDFFAQLEFNLISRLHTNLNQATLPRMTHEDHNQTRSFMKIKDNIEASMDQSSVSLLQSKVSSQIQLLTQIGFIAKTEYPGVLIDLSSILGDVITYNPISW